MTNVAPDDAPGDARITLMGWASAAIAALQHGQTVTIRPRGSSMTGKVNDGDLVTVEPLGERTMRVGDIVLVRMHGREYLHGIKAVQGSEGHTRYLIGNNRGGINGWVGRHAIAGIATKFVRPERGSATLGGADGRGAASSTDRQVH